MISLEGFDAYLAERLRCTLFVETLFREGNPLVLDQAARPRLGLRFCALRSAGVSQPSA
jgi:hypothetical protein